MQVLDDGRITDAQGRTVNFENAIIVMTSNAGSEGRVGGLGFGKTDKDQTQEKTMAALKEFLRPEFLGRVDEVVCFAPLEQIHFSQIKDQCAIAGDGKELEIGFNVRYLADALRAVPSEEVTLELTNGLSPIVLTPVDEKEDFAYMVLPVRLKSN